VCFAVNNQVGYSVKVQKFFAKHPVFTYDKFTNFLTVEGERKHRSTESFLNYHIRSGNIIRIRRGLFATIPIGSDRNTHSVDPYLIAGRITIDAVLAYHTALEFHGKAYSIHRIFRFFTDQIVRPFSFNNNKFCGMKHPKALRDEQREDFGILEMERMGLPVRVVSFERLLVDLFDRLDLAGGWEETWRSMESIEYFNFDKVVEYALLLDNSTTIAKVGFFLEQHRETLMVKDDILNLLKSHCSRQPHYLKRGIPGKLITAWNLVVPDKLLVHNWEEPA